MTLPHSVSLPIIPAADLPRLAYSHSPFHDLALTHPEKFRPVVNSRYSVKPEAGGLWTAPVTRQDHGGKITGTTWTDWCQEEDFGVGRYTGFQEIVPNPEARMLRIDSQPDLALIMGEYELKTRYISNLRTLNDWAVLDYERMAEDGLDGIYMTDAGQWETRTPPSGWSLYGWDLASVLWIRPSYTVPGLP